MVQDTDWVKKGPHQQHHLMELLSLKGHQIMVIGFDLLWAESKDELIFKRTRMPGVQRFYRGAYVDYIRPSFFRAPYLDYFSFLFTSKKEIEKAFADFHPDIVVSFTSIVTAYLGMKKAKKANIPFVYYWTDVTHTLIKSAIIQRIAISFERKLMRGSSKIFAINENLADKAASLGISHNPIEVLPGGIDFTRFNPQVDSSTIRERQGLRDKDLVLFFMGWLYDFSGLKEVVSCLSEVKDNYPHIKLMILGRGGYHDQLVETIANENLQDRVFLLGWKLYDEIPMYIAASDICLLPAQCNEIMKDIVPIKMYEYLAMGKPIVSTKLPGVIREFGSNSGVIYCDGPNDVINTVIGLDKVAIERIKIDARNFIKDYDWNDIVNKFEFALESLISHPSNSGSTGKDQ